MGVPRGIRNNNPFNLVKSGNAWKGKINNPPNGEKTFEVFDTMENGIRAGLLTLRNGYYRKGLKTAEAIINKYCPGNAPGNTPGNTAVYIQNVAKYVFGMDGAWKMDTTGREIKLAYAILKQENGYSPVNESQLKTISQQNQIF